MNKLSTEYGDSIVGDATNAVSVLQRALFIGLLLLPFMGGLAGTSVAEQGHHHEEDAKSNLFKDFQRGNVTGMQGNKLKIDNRDYTLHASVKVTDQELMPMSLETIQVGVDVMFHLTKGQIDHLVVLLPS